MTYQASSGIFPILVCFQIMKDLNNGKTIKELRKFIIESVTGYGIALIFFKCVVMNYVNSYADTSIPTIFNIPKQVFINLYTYYKTLHDDFMPFWQILIIAIVLCFILLNIVNSKHNKFKAAFIILSFLSIITLMPFGIYTFLSSPLYMQRAMYGVGIIIAYTSIYVVGNQKNFIVKIFPLILSWCFLVFCFTYGNALSQQKAWAEYRMVLVLQDLSSLNLGNDSEKVIQLKGSIGLSPVLKQFPQRYSLIEKNLSIKFSDTYWGRYEFLHYYGLKNMHETPSIDITEFNLPVIMDTMYHTIRANDEYVLIEIK